MAKFPLPQPIKLSDSGPPPNANFYPPGKHESFQGVGSPEGRVIGDIGDEYLDTESGIGWKKISNAGFKTGWSYESNSLIAALPTHEVMIGSPEGSASAPPGSTRFDSVGRTFYYKESGTGNTGWIETLSI